MKTMFSTLLFLLASVTCMAQGGTAPSQILFQNYDSYQVPYRIPAIVTWKNRHGGPHEQGQWCYMEC